MGWLAVLRTSLIAALVSLQGAEINSVGGIAVVPLVSIGIRLPGLRARAGENYKGHGIFTMSFTKHLLRNS